MIAVLISLERAADRRAWLLAEMERVAPDLPVRRAPARDVSEPDWAPPPGIRPGRWHSDRWSLRPSDIEIFLSHKAAWEMIVAEDRPGVVLEDDVLLSAMFGDVVFKLCDAPPRGIVKLDALGAPQLMDPPRTTPAGLELRRVRSLVASAAAYLLTPETAAALLRGVRVERTVDDFLFDPTPHRRHARGHDQPILQLEPAVAVQGQFGRYRDPTRPLPEFMAATKRSDLNRRKSRDLAGPRLYRLIKEVRRARNRRLLEMDRDRVLADGGVWRAPLEPDDLRWTADGDDPA